METDSARRAVNVTSILTFLGAALVLFLGAVIILSGVWVTSGEMQVTDPGLQDLSPGAVGTVFIGIGAFFVVLSIFLIFVGRGLWQLRNWARVASVVLSWLAIVLGLIGVIETLGAFTISAFFQNVLLVALGVLFVRTLQFTPEVKALFGTTSATPAATATPVATATVPAAAPVVEAAPAQEAMMLSAAPTPSVASKARAPVKKAVKPVVKKAVKKVVKKTTKRR